MEKEIYCAKTHDIPGKHPKRDDYTYKFIATLKKN